MDPLLAWAASNWGWLVALLIYAVINGDKIAARLGTFIPPVAGWLEKRAKIKAETDARRSNGQSAVLQHVIASDTRGEMTQVSVIERMITILETTLDRAFAGGEVTNKALADVFKQLGELRSVVARHNDLLGGYGQVVAHLADEVEGVRVQVAGVNGKLDSLGAWSGEMQSLRREVSS